MLPLAEAGQPVEAYRVAVAGLTDHPEQPSLHYNLGCHASRAGDSARALEHLARAFAGNRQPRDWAASDRDLDPLRSDPRYPQ